VVRKRVSRFYAKVVVVGENDECPTLLPLMPLARITVHQLLACLPTHVMTGTKAARFIERASLLGGDYCVAVVAPSSSSNGASRQMLILLDNWLESRQLVHSMYVAAHDGTPRPLSQSLPLS